jgi:MinD superfamily P-loop ATPase
MSDAGAREIVVISGKGGTGKTSITAAFAHLAHKDGGALLCDLDVDAPDLHILLDPRHERDEEFFSGNEARIAPERCEACGECVARCRFGAITTRNGTFAVDPLRCEGCGVCVHFCPADAVDFPQRHCGRWHVSTTRFGPMVHAQLFPGEENSGRLVTLLKQQARELAHKHGLDLILADGAPGIGCPVISSLSGAHLAVVVSEPTPSGRHDLERVAELCGHFKIPVAVLLNKQDLNPDEAGRIQALCRDKGWHELPGLPFDTAVTEAMVLRRAVTEVDGSPLDGPMASAWQRIRELAGAR